MAARFAGSQDDVAQRRDIDGIRLTLRYQAKAGMRAVSDSGLSTQRSIERNAAVELQTIFGRMDFERTPAPRIDDSRGRYEFATSSVRVANEIQVAMFAENLG